MAPDVPTAADLPDELVSRAQWVCWRRQERNGTETKVPVNPHNGSFGSTTDAESWAGFDDARAHAADGAVDGLGFVFTATDPLVGVDLDACRDPETGALTDDAETIVETLASYTEVSPSGTGVHVIVIGSLPGDRNRRDWVELYDEARFFTVTGSHLTGTPFSVEPRMDAIRTIHAEYVSPTDADSDATEPPAAASTADPPSTEHDSTDEPSHASPTDDGVEDVGTELSDEAVVERARAAANGEKFDRLWRGELTGYDSHSEADMALCALLAFWTGGDRVEVDRLFRASGLMREKWDERHYADGSTYGEKTVDRVLATTDDYYQPPSESSTEATSQACDSNADAGVDPPAEAGELRSALEELKAREDHQLTVIAKLQAQVERLDAENERLRAELKAAAHPSAESKPDEGEPASMFETLRGWFAPRE